MESGLQELKFSRYNQKVELSGKLFLYNALTGGYASVDEEYRDNFDKCDFKKLDSMKELAELPNAIINQLMEGGFIIPKNFDEFNVIKSIICKRPGCSCSDKDKNNSFTIYSSHVGEWIYNRK